MDAEDTSSELARLLFLCVLLLECKKHLLLPGPQHTHMLHLPWCGWTCFRMCSHHTHTHTEERTLTTRAQELTHTCKDVL